jgi:ribosome-associated protein
MIDVTASIRIPEEELRFHSVRASGPGGQNINKVSTAIQLRFDVRRSSSLPAEVRRRLEKLAGRRMTSEGILVLDARRFRTREKNRADALARLRQLIIRASMRPKRRKQTRPTKSSMEKRLKRKRRKGERKMQRTARYSEE